jgi:hypothetical protein
VEFNISFLFRVLIFSKKWFLLHRKVTACVMSLNEMEQFKNKISQNVSHQGCQQQGARWCYHIGILTFNDVLNETAIYKSRTKFHTIHMVLV